MKSQIPTQKKSNHLTLSDLKVIFLGGKRWLLAVGLAVSVAMFMGWDVLVSLGLASLILSLAPCAIMCALGLCMTKSSCKKEKEDTGFDQ